MKDVSSLRIAMAGGFLFLLPSVAVAHTGAGLGHGFLHGFGHPLAGADHLLAMLAVGLWAAQRGAGRMWLLPVSFVAAMAAGLAIGWAGLGLPGVEAMIVASVILLGLLVALASRAPAAVAVAIVGAFALFHGHAHGTEMAAELAGTTYAAGILAATALLHAAGIGGVLGLNRARAGAAPRVAFDRIAGAAIAMAGVTILLF